MIADCAFLPAEGVGCLDAAHFRHLYVPEHAVHRLVLGSGEGLNAVAGDYDALAAFFDETNSEHLIRGIIFYQ
jgi:hypothetical protein